MHQYKLYDYGSASDNGSPTALRNLGGSIAVANMAAPSEQALLNGPAMPPPDGIIPNFANPPNLNKEITFTLALCMSVATLLISIRMYTKMFIIRSVGHEDCKVPPLFRLWLQLTLVRRHCDSIGKKHTVNFYFPCSSGQAASVGLVVPGVYDMANGGGIHMWDITLKTFFGLLYVWHSSDYEREKVWL